MNGGWRCMGRVLAVASVLLLMALGWPEAAWLAEIHVTTAAELVAALDSAESNGEDDVICLAAGTYTGNFAYIPGDGKALTLRGEDGTTSADVILDGGGSGRALDLRTSAAGGSVQLEGLTIQGGADKQT